MKVIILCGGQGTRIRDANELLPKPLLPIGDRPMVWHIMKSYATHGFNDFVLALGFKGWLIKEYFLNYRSMTADLRVSLGRHEAVEVLDRRGAEDWSVTLAETGESTMTGGRIASLRRYVEGDDLFMVTYGDGVSDVDVGRLVAFHRAHGKIATVTAVHPPGRFGELGIRDGFVREFNEKPQTTLGFINGGFMVFDAKRVWDYLPDNDPGLVLENEPLQGLAAAGELVAFEHQGFWQPMDTLREFTVLNNLWATHNAPWKTWSE